MAKQGNDQSFIDHLLELMQGAGEVSARRMFGGHGIFMHGLMFALVAEQTLYFKVDNTNREMFTRAGLQPFTYFKRGKPCQMSYYQAPEAVFDGCNEMQAWVQQAFAAAQRARQK